MKKDKLPLRKCIACGAMRPKNELYRLIKIDNVVSLDLTYKAQTRGAYVCKDADCIKNAQKRHAFSRHLKAASNDEVVNMLLGELENDNR